MDGGDAVGIDPVVPAPRPTVLSWVYVFPAAFQPADAFQAREDGMNGASRQTGRTTNTQPIQLSGGILQKRS
jgi:hypothetical protein